MYQTNITIYSEDDLAEEFANIFISVLKKCIFEWVETDNKEEYKLFRNFVYKTNLMSTSPKYKNMISPEEKLAVQTYQRHFGSRRWTICNELRRAIMESSVFDTYPEDRERYRSHVYSIFCTPHGYKHALKWAFAMCNTAEDDWVNEA